jgi:hypothetical protein
MRSKPVPTVAPRVPCPELPCKNWTLDNPFLVCLEDHTIGVSHSLSTASDSHGVLLPW